MPAVFEEAGIRFQYPENWPLEREPTEEGWTVLVQSPATAFLMMVFREGIPEPAALADAALEALRADYPDLEADVSVDTLAGLPALGHDIRFISLDLTNTCWTRCIAISQGTLLIMCQYNDLEEGTHQAVLRAMCASLEIED
jgi:hypothetical protein